MNDSNKDVGSVEATEKVPEFPINHQLLEDATHIKEQWRVVRDRLEKIERSRDEVSPAVFERVKSDYQKRLDEITRTLMDKKQDIDGELQSLYATRSKIAAQLEEQRESLEEVKFRNTLGEFSEEEYRTQAKQRQEMIGKFEAAMNAVTVNISRYESIFHEEALLLGMEAAPDIEAGSSEAQGMGRAHEFEETGGERHIEEHERQPLTDEEGYILNEEQGPSYFEGEGEGENTDVSKPPREDSETLRAVEGAQGGEAKRVLPRARIVIISGDLAGAAYPLKDTVGIGRADSNTIVLKDAKTSRQHAQIQQHGNEFVLVDLNSSNGTFVNGDRIEEHVLKNNDEIQIGDYVMQFQD